MAPSTSAHSPALIQCPAAASWYLCLPPLTELESTEKGCAGGHFLPHYRSFVLLLTDLKSPRHPPTHKVQLMTVKRPILNPLMHTPSTWSSPGPEQKLHKTPRSQGGWWQLGLRNTWQDFCCRQASLLKEGHCPLRQRERKHKAPGLQAQPPGAQPAVPSQQTQDFSRLQPAGRHLRGNYSFPFHNRWR